ncbi:MAG: hypothetical protein K6V36_00440 [Anaerolineae bacterium]|nr:hypothetical protein [Anaerolineae bacterium]
MRSNVTSYLLASFLLLLAVAPWMVNSCLARPLLPDELKRRPTHYKETASAVEEAIQERMREAPSTVRVILLPTAVASPTPIVTRIIVVSRGTATPPSPAPSSTRDRTAAPSPAPPPRLKEVRDVITEEMLLAQVLRNATALSISDLHIDVTVSGISATGKKETVLGLKVPIEVRGTLAVVQDSLIVRVESVVFAGEDVTDVYRRQLEDSVNLSLYQLLPRRYVRSFELTEGQVVVHSEVRP